MKFPTKFDKQDYVAWHESVYPNDIPLLEKIQEFRSLLKETAHEELAFISNVIQTFGSIASNEYRIQHRTPLEFEFPLLKILVDRNTASDYDGLFKSTDSIVNKLWRKNKSGEHTSMANVSENISDLVRTEIVTPTLESCKFLTQRLEKENIFFPDPKQRLEFKDIVQSISFEPEMKMASGYFAYHGLIKFQSGLKVEIQVYSSLMKSWRKMSHRLYEKARLRTTETVHDYGTTEARMISLGHLLHLAECELTRLDEELG